MGGATYCTDCYRDLGHVESDFELHLRRRLPDGGCICCGAEIKDGEYVA